MEERVWHQFYDDRVPVSIAFEDVPLPRFLERAASGHGEATALIFINRRLTYRQLKDVRGYPSGRVRRGDLPRSG